MICGNYPMLQNERQLLYKDVCVPVRLTRKNALGGGLSMRRSNWLIVAVLVVASIVFLAMWYALGFNLVDDPLDLVITIIWWAIIIVVCVAIAVVENRRRRSMRTSFVAPGLVYNPEAGIVRVEEGEGYVPALQGILDGLQYTFEKKDVSNDKRIRFTYIVRTDRFADDGSTWTGEVVQVSRPDAVKRFDSKDELIALIDAA